MAQKDGLARCLPVANPKKELKRYGEWWNIDRILEDI